MADLDTELSSLREHLLTSIPQPDLASVAQRSRQRVVRRRMQLGAAVAVLVVSMAVPVLRAQSTGDDPPATPPTSAEEPPATEGYSFEYADATHGYALRDRCAANPPDIDCEFDLLVTANGRTWERRAVPPAKVPDVAYPGLLVLGPNSLVINYSIEATGPEAVRYFSSDAGQTWRPVSEPVGSTAVATIPTGAPLVMYCPQGVAAMASCDDVGTVLPESGQTVPLANQPPLDDIRPGEIPTEGSSWWVAGRDPETLDWMVAVSRDAGRTWSTGKIAKAGKQYGGDWAEVVELDTKLYAFVDGSAGGLLSVFESTDGGTTWTRTWYGKDVPYLPPPVAAADGKLLVHSAEDERTFASSDGGRTFVEAPGRLNGLVEWTRAGYVETSERVWGTGYRLSTDGVNWREIKTG